MKDLKPLVVLLALALIDQYALAEPLSFTGWQDTCSKPCDNVVIHGIARHHRVPDDYVICCTGEWTEDNTGDLYRGYLYEIKDIWHTHTEGVYKVINTSPLMSPLSISPIKVYLPVVYR